MYIMTKNTIQVKTGEDNDIKVVKKVVDVWTKNYFFDKETYAIIVPEIKGLFLNVSIFEKNQVGKNLNIFIRSYLKFINISMYLFSSFFLKKQSTAQFCLSICTYQNSIKKVSINFDWHKKCKKNKYELEFTCILLGADSCFPLQAKAANKI